MSDNDIATPEPIPGDALFPPETDNPWTFLEDFIAKLPMSQRFQHENHLLALVRTRPLSEQHALLHRMKDLGFPVMVTREKLRLLDQTTAKKILVRPTYVTSTFLAEMIYRPDGEPKFGFLCHAFDKPDESPVFVDYLTDGDLTVQPLATRLIANRVALVPSGYEEYGTDQELFAELHALLAKYVLLDPTFATLTTAWLFYTWVADRFSVAVYLRVFGELGTAKTTLEEVVGHLAYRGILAAGATTASPIFRIVDRLGGTLVVDEADHARNDTEWADILKLLNTGTRKGHAVLRSERASEGEAFDVMDYSCFGPKMIASREPLRDAAFESRCLSSTMHWQPMAALKGMPLFLDDTFYVDAQRLRNKLLLWRFRNYLKVDTDPRARIDHVEEARVTVSGLLVLAAIADPTVRQLIEAQLVSYSKQLRASRGQDTMAGAVAQSLLLAWVKAKCPERLLVKTVTEYLQRDLPHSTGKRVGAILHGPLGLTTGKAGGDSYVVGLTRAVMDQVALAYDVDLSTLAQQQGATLPKTPLR